MWDVREFCVPQNTKHFIFIASHKKIKCFIKCFFSSKEDIKKVFCVLCFVGHPVVLHDLTK